MVKNFTDDTEEEYFGIPSEWINRDEIGCVNRREEYFGIPSEWINRREELNRGEHVDRHISDDELNMNS
jgi:hypothetical protein